MLFGFVPYRDHEEERIELCLLPSKPDQISKNLRVGLMHPADYGVYFLSSAEAVTIRWDDTEQARIVQAVPPNGIYLTPDTAERPGIFCVKLKIVPLNNGDYEIYFAKKADTPWLRWSPLSEQR